MYFFKACTAKCITCQTNSTTCVTCPTLSTNRSNDPPFCSCPTNTLENNSLSCLSIIFFYLFIICMNES
jgi:proprotein convertase subtilisin/kexin type 5